MDFNYLLELAKMNEKNTKKDDAKFFPSKLSKAKKVERPAPNTNAVKALLDKKEKDQSEKDKKYVKDRNKLMESRALDKKNNRKILAMINRTKGASKSVLDEAKDLIAVNGEEQCDVDDYGYESAMSQQIFSKLTTGYKEMPEDDRLKFKKTSKADINDIKNRVMDSLKRKHEEDTGVRKRVRKRKTVNKEKDEFINDGDPYGGRSSKVNTEKEPYRKLEKLEEKPIPPVKKVKKPMPPPMSFQDLLKVAKKKHKEPIPQAVMVEDKPVESEERPLTAKEKAEKEEERLRKLRRMWKLPSTPSADGQKEKCEEKNGKSAKANEKPTNIKQTNKNGSPSDKRLSNEKGKPASTIPNNEKEKKIFDRSKYFAVPGAKSISASKPNAPKSINDIPPRHPALMKKVEKPQPQMRRIDSDESEEEYDSEMDDFIDDGGVDLDISSEIGKIFGYDKRKYRHIDEEDDSQMEASYSQMQKEEQISANIGLKEDIEDMKREEFEKKRKKLKLMNLEKAHKRK